MAERKPYWEKLRDPRWQRVRLRIMERDGFRCCECGDALSTLNVHHGYYEKDREPWEYDESTMRTLCEACHSSYEDHLRDIRFEMSRLSLAGLMKVMYCIFDIQISETEETTTVDGR